MDKRKLQFFDKNGYNLNFDWDSRNEWWEGTIYLPRVSVGLYANTSVYVLENINDTFVFPQGNTNDKIVFTWDRLNKFVDEFFMFNFDSSYIIKETSALIYTPNDGPDLETLLINRFDEYEIPLSNNLTDMRVLPIHVAFTANEIYDATTYNRTLIMSYNDEIVAKIKFYIETVEEDERLKIWNDNLGYNITPEDTMIFYKSDIKETKPDYILLNEKRKELMMEGSNIYPYIGSYKAIINAIKFFGYDNLGIIEYWKNVNPNDENFGKIYHSSRYSLTKKETLNVGARTIYLPNKDYKKTNQIALVYSINSPTKEIDEWELPKVKEHFTYTIEEALIKLFALRKKLDKEFMPGSSRIIDIIGEANYFGIQALHAEGISMDKHKFESHIPIDFDVTSKYIHLTDDRYFNRYVIETEKPDTNVTMIKDMSSSYVSDLYSNKLSNSKFFSYKSINNYKLCTLYSQYYNEVFVEHLRYDDQHIEDDSFTPDWNEYISAKVVLSNTSFKPVTFGECEISFGYVQTEWNEEEKRFKHLENGEDITFGNIDAFGHHTVSWFINMSSNQIDDELKIAGVEKEYKYMDWTYSVEGEKIEDYNQLYVELPYVGYYDVTLVVDGKYRKTKKKCIKVEPYQLELKGFYYDSRELPPAIKYEAETREMESYIQELIQHMIAWAVTERTGQENDIDFSMPTYTAWGNLINKGPYQMGETREEWYLADNINSEISRLIPISKYARYIRNGVDVKPYTWFIIGYEFSKIVGKDGYEKLPQWTLVNNTTKKIYKYSGRFFTFLLRQEGNYTLNLTLYDSRGNEYNVSRNIIVVDKTANYNIYQTFKKDYDYLFEQKSLAELRDLQTYNLEIISS